MDASFKINGLKELNIELKKLPDDFRNKSLNGATSAAARVPKNYAQSIVAVDTGTLKKAIRVKKMKSPSKYLSRYQVNINPKAKVVLGDSSKKKGINAKRYGNMVENGTVKMGARPFLRPAYAFKKEEAVEVFRKVLARKIALYKKKIASLRP